MRLLPIFILLAGCAGSRAPALSDAGRAVAASPQIGVPAALSKCESAAACDHACNAGDANACTLSGNLLWSTNPAQAQHQWIKSCKAGDPEGCVALMAVAAEDKELADDYAFRACKLGDMDRCALVGMSTWLRSQSIQERNHDEHLLRMAKYATTAACDGNKWQGCLYLAAYHQQKGNKEEAKPYISKAFNLAATACEADTLPVAACQFTGDLAERARDTTRAKTYLAKTCRILGGRSSMRPNQSPEPPSACDRAQALGATPSELEPGPANRSDDLVFPSNAVLEQQRISGDTQLHPPDAIKMAIMKLKLDGLVASAVVCISEIGLVESVTFADQSGSLDYDSVLLHGFRQWRYRPMTVHGYPVPACSLVTFIYSQS